MRSEFLALISEDKDQFKNELNNILVSMIEKKISEKYLEEASKLLENTVLEPKPIAKEIVTEEKTLVYMPIAEVNNAINNNRTNWLLAKDGSQLEITPDTAKYLAELYKSLNITHKDKLVKLITESNHGFKKAVQTAEKLYRRQK